MRNRKRGSRFLLVAAVLLLGLVSACSGTQKAIVTFDCAREINKGLLLSVDLIWADETEKKEILLIGPEEWWLSDYRNKKLVEPQLTMMTLRGGCSSIVVDTRIQKEGASLIIFADYRGVAEKKFQQIVIPAGSKVTVFAGSDRLVLLEE